MSGVVPPSQRTLVALDIDGTLITWSGELPRSARRAVKRALADPALEVVVATGRSSHSALSVAQRIGMRHGWAVCSNGSVTLRLDPDLPQGWAVENSVTFDPTPAVQAIRRVLPDARFAVEDPGQGFLVTQHFPDGELDGRIRVVTDAELTGQPVTRVILRDTGLTFEQLRQVVEETQLPDVTYAVGWTGWVDLNPPGVCKATALEAVRQRLGILPSQTVAIGDGGNDITMLRWAACGVAMGGSRPEVVEAADQVTAPIEEGGLALVLDHLPVSGRNHFNFRG